MGKPPAMPGDSQSLTFAGIYESLPFVNRSKLNAKEASDEQLSKFKSHKMGLQVSSGLDSKIPEKSNIWPTQKVFR